MNVDRLIHRIEKALREGASEPDLCEFAEEYARYRSVIKGRLEQCVILIGSNKDFTALELAEQPPPPIMCAAGVLSKRRLSCQIFCHLLPFVDMSRM